MGARRSLRMVLDGKDGEAEVPHSFNRPVIQIHVGQLDFPAGDGVDVDRKAVVLGRDLDLSGVELLDRVVRPMMAKFEFIGSATQGEAQNLVSQTDPEDRPFPDELPGGLNQVHHSLRVPRAIADKDTIRIQA